MEKGLGHERALMSSSPSRTCRVILSCMASVVEWDGAQIKRDLGAANKGERRTACVCAVAWEGSSQEPEGRPERARLPDVRRWRTRAVCV